MNFKSMMLSVVFFSIVNLYAQAQPDRKGDYYEEKEHAFMFLVGRNFKPFIQAELGAGLLNHKRVDTEFNTHAAANIRFGYSEHWRAKRLIPKLDERYIFGTYFMSDLQELDPDTAKIHSSYYQFGVGNRTGYGYKLGPLALVPYHQIEFSVNRLEFNAPTGISSLEEDILNRYPGELRLGLNYGGGAKLELFRTLSVNASYETSIVYPRWLFGQWLGSVIIQESAMGIATYFGDDIVEASPVLGPIVYWGIKNGLSLVFANLLRDNMNWPFKSEAPLLNGTIKVGASLVF